MSSDILNNQAGALITARGEGQLCLNQDIRLSDLTLNTIDSDGTLWIVSDIDGWWNLPEPDIQDYPRGLDDGSYESVGRYNARVFTVSGSFIPNGKANLSVARQRLIRAANLCHSGAWFVAHEADYTRGSHVWLSGQPTITTTGLNGRTDFSVTLKAPDPVKYSLNGDAAPGWYTTSRSGGGSLTINNAGNFQVMPMISITGPTNGSFNITNSTTGEVVNVVKKINSGVTLTIDSYGRSLTMGTTRNQRSYLRWDTDWLTIVPGNNSISVGSGIGSGSISIDWRHGWIA